MNEPTAIEIRPRGDGSHWGLTDLYPAYRQQLQKAFRLGQDFDARWSSKKEIVSAKLEVKSDFILVSVVAESDEGFDLVDDARWQFYVDKFGEESRKTGQDIDELARAYYQLTEETETRLVQTIYNALKGSYWMSDALLNSAARRCESLRRTKTRNLARVLRVAEALWEECNGELTVGFNSLKAHVAEEFERYRAEPFDLTESELFGDLDD